MISPLLDRPRFYRKLADEHESHPARQGRTTPSTSTRNTATRHGLVAGATGTGKTVSLMVLAEGFSRHRRSRLHGRRQRRCRRARDAGQRGRQDSGARRRDRRRRLRAGSESRRVLGSLRQVGSSGPHDDQRARADAARQDSRSQRRAARRARNRVHARRRSRPAAARPRRSARAAHVRRRKTAKTSRRSTVSSARSRSRRFSADCCRSSAKAARRCSASPRSS